MPTSEKGKDKEPRTTAVVETVPRHVYDELMKKLSQIEIEVDSYRQKAPIVGVSWFGEGGYGTRLMQPINGATSVAMDGFNDSCVVDLGTWKKIKRSELADNGLLVRDDSIIEALSVHGKVAPDDAQPPSVNSLTNAEAKQLLTGKHDTFKTVVSAMDSHWGPMRLINGARELGINHKPKLAYLRERRDELLCLFRWTILHVHDLRLAGENHDIPEWKTLSQADLAAKLASKEMETIRGGEDF